MSKAIPEPIAAIVLVYVLYRVISGIIRRRPERKVLENAETRQRPWTPDTSARRNKMTRQPM